MFSYLKNGVGEGGINSVTKKTSTNKAKKPSSIAVPSGNVGTVSVMIQHHIHAIGNKTIEKLKKVMFSELFWTLLGKDCRKRALDCAVQPPQLNLQTQRSIHPIT